MRSKRFLLIQIIIFILQGWLWIAPSFGQLRVQNFGIAEGLPQSQVHAITEDSQGYLWIGTLGGGVSRFDGQTFETFTTDEGLVNNFVWDIFIDSTQRIWMATSKGISMFDGIKFHSLKVSTNEGVYVNNIFAAGKDILYLMRDGEIGKVWYDSVLYNQTLSRIENLESVHKSVSGLAFVLERVNDKSNLVIFGRQDSIVIGDIRFGAIHSSFMYNGETVISTDSGLFALKAGSLSKVGETRDPVYCFDGDGKYFVGTSNSKIVTMNSDNNIIDELDPVNYLILSTLVDREGNLWWGTDQGLFKIYSYEFINPFTDKEHQDAIMAICFHDKKLWVGTTYEGVKVYDGANRLPKIYDLGGKARNYVNVIKEDRSGSLWVGTVGGIARFENGKFAWHYTDIVMSAVAFDFGKDNDMLIAGAHAGLFAIHDDIAKSIPEFNSIGVWCITYNDTYDYFALGTTVGLKILNKGKVKSLDNVALRDTEISSVNWLDSQTLVIGTFGEGMFIYSFQTGNIQRIDVSRGLVSNILFFAFSDHHGIWVGTEKGIDLVQYDREKQSVLRIDHFDDTDGLLGLETNLGAVCRIDSTLLFGLVKGVFQYRGKERHPENKIHVKAVNLFYKPYYEPELNQGFSIDSSTVYKFQHDQNHLTFVFNKVTKRNPQKYFYTYKLSDFDQIWSTPSRLKSVTYSNLSPGVYTLELRATDEAGVFVFDKTVLHFRIEPAFYQTGYFKLAVVLLALSIVFLLTYAVYRIRANRAVALRNIQENEKIRLRKEIGQDFHDELGNQVARMINYVGLLRVSEKMEKDIYQTLNGYSQTILNGAKDFVWALDPKNDDLQAVLIHLKDFGERMFSEKNIKFSFYSDLQNAKLPMGYGRQINLIFKEAMTNAFKHSRAESIDFISHVTSLRELSISLKDDGSGTSEKEILNSERGMENMRLRAQKINSKIEIWSGSKGTVVTLTVSIPDSLI